jgi:hypothetical protein
MFSHNKTASWQSTKTQKEKDQLFHSARRSSGKVKEEFRIRQQEINNTRRAEADESI